MQGKSHLFIGNITPRPMGEVEIVGERIEPYKFRELGQTEFVIS